MERKEITRLENHVCQKIAHPHAKEKEELIFISKNAKEDYHAKKIKNKFVIRMNHMNRF
jgi:hypothetical protein